MILFTNKTINKNKFYYKTVNQKGVAPHYSGYNQKIQSQVNI